MKFELGKTVDKYILQEILGHGGTSDVFLALDRSTGREVVLKFLHADMLGDPKSHEHFRREVQIGKLLDHPNIQKLYDLAEDGVDPFLVLEYVPGATLREQMASNTACAGDTVSDHVREARRLGVQIAYALAYAHGQHVAHRDLKPENVIVTKDGRAKVMDFGVAYIEGARRVTWGVLSAQVGTPDYMAPEQIRGVRGDSRTDIYALGMMLFEMIAGRLPYEGDNALSIMNQHVNVNAPPIHAFCKDVPVDVEEIVLKAIRREPGDRWQTMDAFSAALEDPATIDTASLRSEREALSSGRSKFGGIGSRLEMPIWKLLAIVVAVAIAIAAAAVIMRPHLLR